MSNCIFCELIAQNSRNIFYRNDLCAAVLEFCPKNTGHFLIIPLRHVESVFELTDKEFLEFRCVIQNILSNNFQGIDLVEIYRYYHSVAPESDTRVIDRCRHAIEFIKRESELVSSGFSFGINEGFHSGKEYAHLHMHVVPSYENSANQHGFRFLF